MNAKLGTQAVKPNKADKPKKIKVVRDSFTIPKQEFEQIDVLKKRALAFGVSVKKSELLRAGLLVMARLSDAAFKAAVAHVPVLKTGRPEADKAKVVAPQKAVIKGPVTKKATPTRAATTQRPVVKKVSVAPRKAASKRVTAKKVVPVKKVVSKAAHPKTVS